MIVWTPADDERLREIVGEGHHTAEVARRMGRPDESVRDRMRRLNLVAKRKGPKRQPRARSGTVEIIPEERVEELAALPYGRLSSIHVRIVAERSGLTRSELADRWGIPLAVLLYRLGEPATDVRGGSSSLRETSGDDGSEGAARQPRPIAARSAGANLQGGVA